MNYHFKIILWKVCCQQEKGKEKEDPPTLLYMSELYQDNLGYVADQHRTNKFREENM